jgi:hypothetical protein
MDEKRSWAARLFGMLRTVFYAILIAFVVGWIIGTFLRQELERPTRYIGALSTEASAFALVDASAFALGPGDIGDALASVLVARDHEEQV